MVKATTLSRRRTSGTVFGWRGKGASTLLFAVIAASTSVSCISVSPPGEAVAMSVVDVQQGDIERGVPLRWGGTIASVRNKTELTVLEIVSRPLLRTGRPRHNDQTDGRFLAEISGFLDPEIVRPGRDISVIGTFDRVDSGEVGEAQYRYPVVSVFDYRFWKEASEIDQINGYPHYFTLDRIWRDWPYRRRSAVYGSVLF